MGLGGYPAIKSFGQGARTCRRLSRHGRRPGSTPIEARSEKRAAANVEAAKTMTFDASAKAYITAHEAGWRNAKHRQQWTNTSNTYASPCSATSRPGFDTGLVLKVVEPIWPKKPETARASVAASRPSSTGPRCAAIARARTRPDGADISTTCYRRKSKSGRSSTSAALPYPQVRLRG